jgi:hypothetical protein
LFDKARRLCALGENPEIRLWNGTPVEKFGKWDFPGVVTAEYSQLGLERDFSG